MAAQPPALATTDSIDQNKFILTSAALENARDAPAGQRVGMVPVGATYKS